MIQLFENKPSENTFSVMVANGLRSALVRIGPGRSSQNVCGTLPIF